MHILARDRYRTIARQYSYNLHLPPSPRLSQRALVGTIKALPAGDGRSRASRCLRQYSKVALLTIEEPHRESISSCASWSRPSDTKDGRTRAPSISLRLRLYLLEPRDSHSRPARNSTAPPTNCARSHDILHSSATRAPRHSALPRPCSRQCTTIRYQRTLQDSRRPRLQIRRRRLNEDHARRVQSPPPAPSKTAGALRQRLLYTLRPSDAAIPPGSRPGWARTRVLQRPCT